MSSDRTFMEGQIPDPVDLYEYILPAVEKLKNNEDNIPGGRRIETSLDNAYRQLDEGDESNWELKLDPYLIFDVESSRDFPNGHGQIRIGGNIEVENGEYQKFSSSLILAVQEPDDEEQSLPSGLDHCCVNNSSTNDGSLSNFYHILERIHWDIDTGDDDDEAKPVCHVQVGGNIPDSAFDTDWEKYHYCSNNLDKPRIPHPPMDCILIFNLAIEQYESLESFHQSEWEGIICKGESALWNPYYSSTYGMINDDGGSVFRLMQNY